MFEFLSYQEPGTALYGSIGEAGIENLTRFNLQLVIYGAKNWKNLIVKKNQIKIMSWFF